MKLRDIVLSATIGLGLIGCIESESERIKSWKERKKVESWYNSETFPKADSVVVDSTDAHYIVEEGFKDGLKIQELVIYRINGKKDTISVARSFYNDKRRGIRMEYDVLETRGLDKVEIISYNKGMIIWGTDYGADGSVEFEETSRDLREHK